MTFVYIGLIVGASILLVKTFRDYKNSRPGPSRPQPIISTSHPAEGVKVDVLQNGTGPTAVDDKLVRVHYTAWLTSGKKVDSSYDKGEVFQFRMGNREVIPGWEAGMIGMKEGEKRKFTIEPDQAYGTKGKANVPPNATIIFEVELLKVI